MGIRSEPATARREPVSGLIAASWISFTRLLIVGSSLLFSVNGISAQEVNWTRGVSLGGIYSDNIGLRASDEQSELVISVTPFVSLQRDGRRADVNFDYRLQGLFYTDESDANEIFHQFGGGVDATLIEDRLFLDLNGSYYQSVVDPNQAIPLRNYQISGNRTDVLQYGARPRFVQDIGSYLRFEAEYEYARQDYQDSDAAGFSIEDLVRQQGSASIASSNQEARLSWRATYQQERTEYDVFPEFEFESAELEVGLQVAPSVKLIAAGGAESDMLLDARTANLDGDFWEGGFRWQPRPGTHLELRAGDRYFGNSITGDISYQRGRVSVSMNYSESASTTGRDRLMRRYMPGDDDLVEGLAPLTPEVFIGKRYSASARLEGARSDYSLTAYSWRREYVTAADEDKDRGVSADWSWQVGPRTALTTRLGWHRLGFRSSERNDEISTLDLAAERKIRPNLFGTASYRYTRRDSDSNPAQTEYQENAIYLQVTRLF